MFKPGTQRCIQKAKKKKKIKAELNSVNSGHVAIEDTAIFLQVINDFDFGQRQTNSNKELFGRILDCFP